jgi:uncharacterized protein YbjT (DUF2867 family)
MPGVDVRAAVHSRPAKQAGGVEVVEVDHDRPQTVRDAAAGADAVLMITPATPNQSELAGRMLQRLAAAGVPRLVRLSAMGADTGEGGPFIEDHGVGERLITESGIPATILRPNSFMRRVRA